MAKKNLPATNKALPPASELTDEQIVELLRRENDIKNYLKAVRSYCVNRAINKKPVAGTKTVEGRTNRRWSGTIDEICDHLEVLGVTECVEVQEKLLGITTIQKQIADNLDKEKFPTGKARSEEAYRLLQTVTIKPQGEIHIVLEDDKRPAIELTGDRIKTAADLFTDLE